MVVPKTGGGMTHQLLLRLLLLVISSEILRTHSSPSRQSTLLFDKGINRLFDFSLPNSAHWTYRVLENQPSQSCEPQFDVSKDGSLFSRRNIWEVTNKMCSSVSYKSTHYLTVYAANRLSPVNLSFSVIVSSTKAKQLLTIPLIEIQLYTHKLPTDRSFDVSEILMLQQRLSALLPLGVIKSSNHAITNSRMSDIFISWNYFNESHVSNTLSLNSETNILVQAKGGLPEHKLRIKRQIFSNLYSPVFSKNSYVISIREEISSDTGVVQIVATDEDEGSSGTVRYSLHADVDQRSLNLFLINPSTGWVTTKARVDREDIASHRFTVRALDQGSPSNSAQAALTITVQDINDHAPSFELSVYNINISETVTVTSTIARIRADDEDIGHNKDILYSIVNSQAVPDFNINRHTGDISVAKSLNRENVSEYLFVVKAIDQAINIADRLTSTVTVNIKVIDFNDNPPEFTKSDYTFQVSEDIDVSSGPVLIGEVIATDADYGNNGIVRYSITFGNQLGVFEIVADTGELRVITPLDRDVPGGDEYNLRVRAGDQGSPPLNNVVSVKVIVQDVNDHPPSFRYPSYSYNVFEDHQPEQPIVTMVATDPDEGANSALKYSILPNAQKANLPISIDRNTGVITNNATLDRETASRYEFTVLVQDSGSPPQFATSNITINILDRNDNKPQFTQNVYSVMISEDTAVLHEVTIVTADDPDENDDITYSIISGDGNSDFIIIKEQEFGIIKVNKALSYDTKKYYSLKVRAVDSSGQLSDCTVQVNVTDKNSYTPVFRQEKYTFKISESAVKGDPIGTVTADDADIELNGEVTYFFINSGQTLPFRINPTTGEIIVNNTLDRDNPQTQDFYVDVIARDRGLSPLQTAIPAVVHVVIEDINDNAPIFGESKYTTEVSEDKNAGYSVITVSATDADKPGTPNSQVRYTFEGGDNGNGSFSIEYAGGTIRVNKSLDRESTSEYKLVVYATDLSPLSVRQSSSVIVMITVLDVNDNAPQFESDTIVRRIYENKPQRSAVEPAIRATDADLGDNSKIIFELVGGDVTAFELKDLKDGSFKLYSKVPLDYESLRKNYTLEVQASSEHMITKAKVIIKLQDVNDNRPELKNFSIIINNYRGHFPDGYIGRVPAFDPDESDRSNLRYTIKSGNEANFLTLNSTTGYMKLNRALDSDRPTSGEFVVQVSDVLNIVNATCKLVYRLITDDMLKNSVTLRLDDITVASFMTRMYGYTVQALAAVLRVFPRQIYIIDIKQDTEVDTDLHNPVLNVSFAAVQEEDGKDLYMNQEHIKEQIYRRLDLLKNLSAVTIIPFDDTLCVIEPCLNYGQNITYTCDREINLCYSNPCLNTGVCKQVEGGFTCICPTGYKGERCEHDTLKVRYNSSYCPSEVCTGKDSYCVDLIRGGFACHQGAVRCVETDSRTDTCTIKTVSFQPFSYLMFPALQSRIRFNIRLSFATRKKSGLLLYNGRYNHLHDFIALELVNHSAVLKMSLGSRTYSVSVGKQYGLNDGQWHTVDVDYRDSSLVISLDHCDVGLSLSRPELFNPPCAMKLEITECIQLPRAGKACSLDVTGPLLIGGLPEYLGLDETRLSSSYFVGCIRDLHINYKLIDLNSAIANHTTREGCSYKGDFCVNSPCRNKGTCTPSWMNYRCECPEEASGDDCSIRTGPSSTFYGNAYLKYTTGFESVRKPWYNRFLFKTTVDDRLIMRINLEQEKMIEYKMESGYITFIYGDFFYQLDEVLVNDDKWHHFEMRLLSNQRGQGQLLLRLDYGNIQKSVSLDNSLDGLSVQEVWVGGDESTKSSQLGYYGCIKDVIVGSIVHSLSSPSVRNNVQNGCNYPTVCNVRCPADRSQCEIGWEQSTCRCNEGLYGPSCAGVCRSSYDPCQHGSECRIHRETALGYKCVCTTGYQGTYCEEKTKTRCPASWWGTPVCGPCNCSVELNFDSQCDRKTGVCVCKNGYYKHKNSGGCIPCKCYYNLGNGGALGTSCDQTTGECKCRADVLGKRCDGCDNPFAEVTGEGCIVQYDSCPKSYNSGVWWTRTKFGVVRIESCPSGSVGNVTRVCKGSDDGWLIPVLSGCTSSQFLALNKSLLNLESRMESNQSEPVHPVSSDSYTFIATNIVSALRNATDQVETLYSNDLLITVKILKEILLREKVGKSFDLTHAKDRYFLENLVHITSRALSADLTAHWIVIVNSYKSSALTDLIQNYDDYIANLADNMATKFVTAGMDPFQITTDKMVLGMDIMRSNEALLPKYNNIQKDDSIFDDVTSVQLPPQLFTEKSDGLLEGKAVSGYIIYKDAGELMASVASSQNNPYELSVQLNKEVSSVATYGGIILNSAVFSLVLQQGEDKPSLQEALEVTFLLRIPNQTKNVQCVYLNSERKWTSDSCSVKKILEDRVICSCQHLSTYALITNFDKNASESTSQIGVHMYVAVAFSLCCFFVTLLVFVCLKDLKSNYIYNQINIQLCFCVALIIFIAGSGSWSNQAACTVVSVMLQFFVLSLFAWIFVNAFHLCRILTEKRYIDGEAMLLYVLIGYVGPGVVTGLSVGLNPEEFGTEKLCWLDISKPMIWSLAGPVLFCCVAVEVFLILSIISSCQEKTITSSTKKRDVKIFKSAIWVALASLPLTFCTWLFALLTVNSPAAALKPYDYMFSTFTCVTAVFTLLAHVVFNKRGRGELQRRWKRCQGHGRLEESDTSDKPNNAAFGEYSGGAYGFGGGSESSTTSNSRLTSGPSPDLLAYLRHPQSSTSSDIPTFSQLGAARSRRRRRAISDGSSDSETDSEIRTEREKDIELASSHSSDEDEPMPPVAYPPTVTVNVRPVNNPTSVSRQSSNRLSPATYNNPDPPLKHHSTPNAEEEMGFAPPPPYFVIASTKFSSRLSDSTASTNGSQSKADSISMQSSNKNLPFTRPTQLQSFTGGSRKVTPPPIYDLYQQHTNKSFISSPSMSEKLVSDQQSPVADGVDADGVDGVNGGSHLPAASNNSLHRQQHSNSYRRQPSPANQQLAQLANQHRVSPSNQHRESPVYRQNTASPLVAVVRESDAVRESDIALGDSDSVRTQSSIKSNQDEVFMPPPPPPALALHLTMQPSSGSASSSLARTGSTNRVILVETDLDLLNDVDNETQV